jgi:hypothetical protein
MRFNLAPAARSLLHHPRCMTRGRTIAASRHEVGFLQDDSHRSVWQGLCDAIEQCRNEVRRIILDALKIAETVPAQKSRPSK